MREPGRKENVIATAQVSKSANARAKKPRRGYRIHYEDDLVEVYDDRGRLVDSGMLDYSVYKDEEKVWNEKDKNYDLPHGYKMVGLTKH